MSCNHNCSQCSNANCNDRNESLIVETASENNIKKIIAIASGKGGVGKSTVTSLLAVNLTKRGYKVGIIDADITGPSIPKAFGIKNQIIGNGNLMFPAISKLGIKIISVNLLIEDPAQPVLWRGPIIGGAVKQFYTDVLWEDLDYLLIDMPPGTGDVALTTFQSIPVDEVIMVTTPQDLVSLIVKKAVNMCNMMNIKLLGLVENMSYINCNCCNNIIYPFGKSKLDDISKSLNILPLDKLPINPETACKIDNGLVEEALTNVLDNTVETIISN